MIWSRETARLAARVDELEERLHNLSLAERVSGARLDNLNNRVNVQEDDIAKLWRMLDARTEQSV